MTIYNRLCCVAFLAEISAEIGLLHACKKKPVGNHATVVNWTKGAKASRGKVGTEVDTIWPLTSGRAMHFIANISTQGFDFRIGPQISCDLATTVAAQKFDLVDVRKCLWMISVSSVSQGCEISKWKASLKSSQIQVLSIDKYRILQNHLFFRVRQTANADF